MYMKYPMAEAMRMAFWSSIPLPMKMMRGNRKKKTKLVKIGKFIPILIMFPGENGDGDSESRVDGFMIIFFWSTRFFTFLSVKKSTARKKWIKKAKQLFAFNSMVNFFDILDTLCNSLCHGTSSCKYSLLLILFMCRARIDFLSASAEGYMTRIERLPGPDWMQLNLTYFLFELTLYPIKSW
jgi:hypothetical protein